MFKLDLEKAEEPENKLPTSVEYLKSKTVPEKQTNKQTKNRFIDYAKAFDCVDHNKLENSERVRNTRPPDLPLEKSVYRSGSNS